MCAISVLMEENAGGEFEGPRFAVGTVIAECCKMLVETGKVTREETLKLVGTIFGMITHSLCSWEGKIKN